MGGPGSAASSSGQAGDAQRVVVLGDKHRDQAT